MSLLFSHGNCSLLSHEQFINQIYQNDSGSDANCPKYNIRSNIFDLNVSHRIQTNSDDLQIKKKRRKIIEKSDNLVINEHPNEYALIAKIKDATLTFMKLCREREFLLSYNSNEPVNRTNERLKQFLNEWKSIDYLQSSFCGGNDSTDVVVFKANNQNQFLIPPKCRFFNKNIKQLEEHADLSKAFDLIVMDPPWWNKYVRRTRKIRQGNGYEMLSNTDIANIPIVKWTRVDQTLVAIWCTNAPSMIRAVCEQFLAKWKLKLLATWYWIKITKHGETICDFDLPLKKQPFERVFIACHIDSGHDFKIPNEKMIFSVPSAVHSHKPPLHDLLRPHLIETDHDHSTLELFARYLLPGCTSIGLEVLKLQNLQLFCDNHIEK